ncbi:zinc finger protein 280C-like isoform X3 [Meriones unguiculatus]|uniref:zinc finger protein 280C-like isoform X3 n=1 Tax=Meriones unguiculatus TaxID=10047 RepID=UPI00293E72D4|nr:zinc finger protein 280C-like isoform X3 [Meriones unguiculatus]
MGDLYMGCEEEELEPCQHKTEEIQDEGEDEDDELIFVGETSVLKPDIPNVLQTCLPSSSSEEQKGDLLNPAISNIFKTTNQHYRNLSPNAMDALLSFDPEPKSSEASDDQAVSDPNFSKTSSQDDSGASSDLPLDSTNYTPSSGIPKKSTVDTSEMAEVFMGCKEEVKPCQHRTEEIQNEGEDDDDELIFVGEISTSKPVISNILNTHLPSSSTKGRKSDLLNPAISNIFKTTNQHYRNLSPNAVDALPSFDPEPKSSEASDDQAVFYPNFSKTSSQDDSGTSSDLPLDSTNYTPSSGIPKKSTDTSEMAEHFMGCCNEELEPCQHTTEEIKTEGEDEDDELIFVGEISTSKPDISNILNIRLPSSSIKGRKSNLLNPAISNIFKTTNQQYRNPSPDTVVALPSFDPEPKSAEASDDQAVSDPNFSKTSSQDDSGASSDLPLDSTNYTPSSGIPKKSTVDTSEMAEHFMGCCNEELEPCQHTTEEIKTEGEDEDDELIFVGEISTSKPDISNILNEGLPSSSAKGQKSDLLNPAISSIFKTTNQQYRNPSPDTVVALPSFDPEPKSAEASDDQAVSDPNFSKTSSQDDSGASSDLPLDSTNYTPSSGIPKKSTGINQTSLGLKHPSTSEVNSVNPKKPKTDASVSKTSPLSSSSLLTSPSEPSPQAVESNINTSSLQSEAGDPSLQHCPNCHVKFRFLDLLKCHIKRCCPDMINHFLETLQSDDSKDENKANIGSDEGKLIMLVSDFYYGRHEGAIAEHPKTHRTFKCFRCSKVFKNNIRFMNHMKHHLKPEKQKKETWKSRSTSLCKICELSFETEHIFLQHMKDTHKPGEMPYVCQVCQFRSSIFSDVEIHFKSSHENTENLLCPFCLKVSRMATPYVNHCMRHQRKGIHHCPKCRLQFLTCKEKTDHNLEHRTFIQPKELEGLPSGTKVTIQASLGSAQSSSSSPSSSSIPSISLEVSAPMSKITTTENNSKVLANKVKKSKPETILSTTRKPKSSKPGTGITKSKAKPSYKQKRQRTRKSKLSIYLKNLRCHQGIHTCIECHSKITDFSSHFSTFINCDVCKYTTNCNQAFTNHTISHNDQPSKQFYISKKHSQALRGITLVCLKCDFLAGTSGLDRMAKHLSQRKTHTCQVVIEDVTERTLTPESTSDGLLK